MTALRAGLQRNSDSVPSKDKEYFFTSSRSAEDFRGPPRLLFNGYNRPFSQGNAQLPQMPSWIAKPQLFYYYYYYFYFTEHSSTFGRRTQVQEEYVEFCIRQCRIKTGRVTCLQYINKFFYRAKFDILTKVTIQVVELRNVTPCILTQIC